MIQVRFFASLRDKFGEGKSVEAVSNMLAEDVWFQLTQQELIPANVLIAVNQEYVDQNYPVQQGDEVAFFPPVTGG